MRFATIIRFLPASINAVVLAGILAACSNRTEHPAQQEIGNETLAAALADNRTFDAFSDALYATGLSQAFDGTAAYTVLAPGNDALERLEAEIGLNGEGRRAVLAAILREHVLPGTLTPADIEKAIAAQHGEVTVRTMGPGLLRFSMNGDRLTVTNENGLAAEVTGAPILVSNGVVIPIDRVLKKP